MILSDDLVYKKSGMRTYSYQQFLSPKGDPRKITERSFPDQFPLNTIVTPLYIDYPSYSSIKKPEEFRSFFIYRDPRDIIVSWYFSVKDTHPLMGKIPEHRKKLQSYSLEEGLLYSLNYLNEFGVFEAFRSWFQASESIPEILFFPFEELIDKKKQNHIFNRLFTHCTIEFSQNDIHKIINKYSFDRLKKKKRRGGFSHFRHGVPGDWRSHFTPRLLSQFIALTGDLLTIMGYAA
jgi:hypothetical protein